MINAMRSIVKSLRTIIFCVAVVFVVCPSVSFADPDTNCTPSETNSNCFPFEMTFDGTVNFFNVQIGATGTFYIDCGRPGATLAGSHDGELESGSGVYVRHQATTNATMYVCVYGTPPGESVNIRIGGVATGYSSTTSSFALTGNQGRLTSVSGDLSAVFPILSTGTDTEPLFTGAFNGCSNLTWIPASMFYGYRNSAITNNSTWTNIFAGTGTQKACPAGYTNVTSNYYSGYSSYWNSMPACEAPAPTVYTITLNDSGATTSGETVSGSNMFYESAGGGFYSDSGASNSFSQLVTLPVNAPYTFNGYWTGQNGSGTQVINSTGAPVTGVSLGADTTIYADWILVTPFSVTTTNLSSGDVFKFKIGAGGTFYVDCGTDGTLYDGETNTSIPNGFFTKYHNSWWTEHLYYCSYTTGGVKQIGFGGIADSYPSLDDACASIRFGKRFNSEVNNGSGGWEDDVTAEKLAGISGSLGAVFPTIDEKRSPAFFQTFQGCSNLTGTIPSNLFTGATLAHPHMFEATFEGCYGLTGAIPTGLFDIVSGGGGAVFCRTFYDCRGLTGSIPTGLFGGVSGNGIRMFENTFHGCSGLTGAIPSGLFSGVTGSANQLFQSTFEGCSGLTSAIPTGLFGNVSGSGEYMFENTFKGCSGLTGAIPSGLFSGVTGTETHLFNGTFEGCAGLTGTIPSGLFGNVSGTAMEAMFRHTFKGCSNLSGLIPSDLFGSVTGYADWLFSCTFENCSSLTGVIPSGLFGRNVNGSYVGVSGAAIGMFDSTFRNCRGLTGAIPLGLFGGVVNNTYYGVTGHAEMLFQSTFENCSSLTGAIPSDLFGRNVNGSYAGVSGAASKMFNNTFAGCTNLGRDSINGTSTYGIPSGLFRGVSGAAEKLFQSTFMGDAGLTGTIPDNLFSGVSESAEAMFQGTFAFCTGLNGSIPSGLFDHISGAAPSMFLGTFVGCSSLSGQLPSDLFAGISGSAPGMFQGTFGFCEHLGQEYENNQWVSKYNIPSGLFGNSINASSGANMFDLAFYDTGFLDCCASGMRKITTNDNNVAQFMGAWSGVGDYQQLCSEIGLSCPQSTTEKPACIAGTPAAGETTWVEGQCVEGCSEKLNVKPENGVLQEYFMYKRTGTLIGDKTLNVKQAGSNDTCYVPLKNETSGPISGRMNLKIGNSYYSATPISNN